MKSLFFLSFLMFTTFAQAAVVCDLKANDMAVDELNEVFDQAGMSGEDHVIGLKVLYIARLNTIKECLISDVTGGITQEELKDVVIEIQDSLKEYVIEMNEAIRNNVDHDRIGMATELTRERDMQILDTKNLIAKIKKLISK